MKPDNCEIKTYEEKNQEALGTVRTALIFAGLAVAILLIAWSLYLG